MRGRLCTQPFLVEGGACRPDALLLPPRWASRSPPHPTRLRRPTFPPRGRLWGREGPFLYEKPPPPARPAGGRAVTGVGSWAAGQAEKRENPRRVPPTRKGGSREEEPLPPWCSFLRLSSKESRAPARGRAGNGALRPEAGTSPAPGGYAVPPRIPTPQVLTCGGPRRVHLPTAEAPGPTWGPLGPPNVFGDIRQRPGDLHLIPPALGQVP